MTYKQALNVFTKDKHGLFKHLDVGDCQEFYLANSHISLNDTWMTLHQLNTLGRDGGGVVIREIYYHDIDKLEISYKNCLGVITIVFKSGMTIEFKGHRYSERPWMEDV